MSSLTIFHDDDPASPAAELHDHEAIRAALAPYRIGFERVAALADLAEDATNEAVLAACAPFIDAERRARGYKTADVVRIARGQTGTEAIRAKFLEEHTHSEDEARLFAEGSGAFYLHLEAKVLQIVCERGDYLRIPAGARHWFDMGPRPFFTAVRLFTDPAGWVAAFTGDPIAARFPRFE